MMIALHTVRIRSILTSSLALVKQDMLCCALSADVISLSALFRLCIRAPTRLALRQAAAT